MELGKYRNVKITVDIPVRLLRAAQAKAKREGRTLSDIVVEQFQKFIAAPVNPDYRRIQFPLIKGKGPTLGIPDDIASRLTLQDDIERHEALMKPIREKRGKS